MIKAIQTSISGYGGSPCTLFSTYDEEKRIAVIAVEAEYRADRRAGCLVVTNDLHIERDELFKDEHIKPAIKSYFDLKGGVAADGQSTRLVFSDRAIRSAPESIIERDGYDENGPRYRVADGVGCAHIAALATCYHIMRSEMAERSVKLAQSFKRLGMGEILTV